MTWSASWPAASGRDRCSRWGSAPESSPQPWAHPVLGVDLSVPMLRRAQERMGARVALGDGYRLPVRDRAVPNAALVWVLQLVPDVPGFLAEAARTVAPGGRIVAVPAGGDWAPDDLSAAVDDMILTLRPPQDRPEQIETAARALGLRVVARAATTPRPQHDTPEDLAVMIEQREWSMLWDLDDRTWARVRAARPARPGPSPGPGVLAPRGGPGATLSAEHSGWGPWGAGPDPLRPCGGTGRRRRRGPR